MHSPYKSRETALLPFLTIQETALQLRLTIQVTALQLRLTIQVTALQLRLTIQVTALQLCLTIQVTALLLPSYYGLLVAAARGGCWTVVLRAGLVGLRACSSPRMAVCLCSN